MTTEEMIEDAKLIVIWTGEHWMAGYYDSEHEYIDEEWGTIDGHVSMKTITVAYDMVTAVRAAYPKVVAYCVERGYRD